MTENAPLLVLASASPRRRMLLEQAGLSFVVMPSEVEEIYPASLKTTEVPEYLARIKAAAVLPPAINSIIIAADTVVILGDRILGKPVDKQEAISMLEALSGNRHEVVTGVSMVAGSKVHSFSDSSQVYFNRLSSEEIHYYIHHFAPFDKAGGYGIQDWIGMIGVRKIEGSYCNVMGLPIDLVIRVLNSVFSYQRVLQ